ncbi:hypothetical protein [Fulvivirga ligni]|uniref:hypothetical protein n=1 Tax=Fulvivirga ligni TaxID=2904246 RepID=UPI001F19959D|nr:hypothetical protein [Fulvivirga ligni]UII19394.1 hypothetical protein LVD16_16265 [Fulvivirga ligni]
MMQKFIILLCVLFLLNGCASQKTSSKANQLVNELLFKIDNEVFTKLAGSKSIADTIATQVKNDFKPNNSEYINIKSSYNALKSAHNQLVDDIVANIEDDKISISNYSTQFDEVKLLSDQLMQEWQRIDVGFASGLDDDILWSTIVPLLINFGKDVAIKNYSKAFENEFKISEFEEN